jgi:UPF0271 protein
MVIDLNADMGESREALVSGSDGKLMQHISSVNVACGGHAGDEMTVHETLRLAKSLTVNVGAHPSYPDRKNFGRAEMNIEPDALENSLIAQMNWLLGIAQEVGVRIVHVKPHGALYHAMGRRREIAAAVASAIRAIDPKLIVIVQAGSAVLAWCRKVGLATASEAFADRAYESDGSLRDRRLPGALLEVPERAAAQAVDIVAHGFVRTFDGGKLPIKAETLCIHSDTPGAINIAVQIRKALANNGVRIAALSRSQPSAGLQDHKG